MNIKCTVTAIESHGETITVNAAGTIKRMADWRRPLEISFDLPQNKRTARTFHLGRTFTMTIKP